MRGWWQDWWPILRRAWREVKADHVSLLAAGVAFYGFLSLFPALIAAVLIYGLVADPDDVQRQVDAMADVLPADAQSVVGRQLTAIATTSDRALGLGLAVAVLGGLWTVSGGVKGLITATNIAYDRDETRGWLRLRVLAVILTVGAILFMLSAVVLIAAVPIAAEATGVGGVARVATEVVRWPLLVCSVMVALAVVYRIAPDRVVPRARWVSIGAVVATLLWVVASVGFSVYVNNFGRYGNTYGGLAGVVVLLLWMYVSAFIVLLGAEINAEVERDGAGRARAAA